MEEKMDNEIETVNIREFIGIGGFPQIRVPLDRDIEIM